jgi:hypothetical protein
MIGTAEQCFAILRRNATFHVHRKPHRLLWRKPVLIANSAMRVRHSLFDSGNTGLLARPAHLTTWTPIADYRFLITEIDILERSIDAASPAVREGARTTAAGA